MSGPNGAIDVPFSKVEQAKQQGYSLNSMLGSNDAARYEKDKAYSGRTVQTMLGPVSAGVMKSAVQVPNTIASWLDSIAAKVEPEAEARESQQLGHPVRNDYQPGDLSRGLQAVEEKIAPGVTAPLHGPLEHTGGFAETLGEWLYGEGEAGAAFKGLAQSEKLAKIAQAAKFIEAHPQLARMLRVAATSVGSGTQAAAHGATPGEALTAGAVGAGAGTLGEIPGAIKSAGAKEAARQATVAGHEAAPAVLAERTAAEGAARQATAQQGVKDVAARATNDAYARFNAAMASVPGFTERVAPAAPKTFAEGAEALKDEARPLFQRADAVEGYNGKLKDLMAQHDAALENIDYKAADKAEIAIDDLLAKRPADVTPAEQGAMKMAWRDAKVLGRIHAATEGAFNGISEEIAAQPGTSERLLKSGTKEGGSLQLNLGRVMNTPAQAKEVYRVLGQDGVANLYRASNLVSNPAMAKATAELAEQVGKEFPAPKPEGKLHRVPGAAVGTAVGATIGHAVGGGIGGGVGATLGGVAGGALSDSARDVLRKMVMSPRVGQLMDFAVRNNVDRKIAAMAIAAEIQREQAYSIRDNWAAAQAAAGGNGQ